MSYIDCFDECTGRVFALLYESFPIPIDLNIGDIIGQAELYLGEGLPPEMNTECDVGTCTVRWLVKAGYISMDNCSGSDRFFNLQLTEKGLEVLKAVPGSLNSQSQPLGKQISLAFKSGAKDALKVLTNQALAIGIKYAAHKLGF